MALFEGNCEGKAINVEFGSDNKGKMRVRWDMEVIGGPHAGKRAQYSGKLDPDNIKYTKAAMVAIGWKGKDVRTFLDDVARANHTVSFTAEIAENQKDNGKISRWTSAKSIGFVAQPLEKPSESKLDDVNGWFAEVPDAPQHPNAPGADEDIPF